MTTPNKIIREVLGGISLVFILYLVYSLYLPGVTGIFLFDDNPNLSPLGKYSNYSLLDNFWLFLLEGISGPTGRPVSLASFYLNDIHWPSKPAGFIHTNILIHLLNGILVFWLSLKLSNYLKLSKKSFILFSLLVTLFWLSHPMHITSVLYIIQRMTELSATFLLSGLIFYLYGREKLQNNTIKGLVTLYLGVGISLVLAILSKENGILLVAYILVIEFFLLQPLGSNAPKHLNNWLIPAVIAPFISLLIYLGAHTSPERFNNRDFSLTERLLTEPRILFDYLHQIVLPKMGDLTLYHDDYIISKSLLDPWTTLPALLGIIFLIGLAFYLRKKAPIIAFAIAWFFAGHLIESTVLPLELYFEHRNYLPMLGIFITGIYYAFYYFKAYKKPIIIALVFLLSLNNFSLSQNTKLWGKPFELIISWYEKHPESIRAKNDYINISEKYNLGKLTIPEEQKNIQPKEGSLLYGAKSMLNLANACEMGSATPQNLTETLNILKPHVIHRTTSSYLNSFVYAWFVNKCLKISSSQFESFLLSLASLERVKNLKLLAHDTHYSLSKFYRQQKDFNNQIIHLEKAYTYYPHTDILMVRAGDLATAKRYKDALSILDDTSLLKKGIRQKLIMMIKQKELDEQKLIIREEMQKDMVRDH